MEIVTIKYMKSMQNEALTANQQLRLAIPEDAIDTHRNFNEIVVTNVSSSDILITPDDNTSRAFIVPAKGSFIWSFRDDNFRYSSILYKELSGNAVDASKIYFLITKKRYKPITKLNDKGELEDATD